MCLADLECYAYAKSIMLPATDGQNLGIQKVIIPLQVWWDICGKSRTKSMLNEETFDATLNKIAADGWELVTVTSIVTWGSGATTNIIATFKRPKNNLPIAE